MQFTHPSQTTKDNHKCQRNRSRPENPLIEVHITDVTSIHAKDGGDSAEREEDDGHDGEDVDGSLLIVFVGVDLLHILRDILLVRRTSDGEDD